MSQHPVELQHEINRFWNERAASYAGAPHHAIEDERQRQAWLGALAALLPPAPVDILDVGARWMSAKPSKVALSNVGMA